MDILRWALVLPAAIAGLAIGTVIARIASLFFTGQDGTIAKLWQVGGEWVAMPFIAGLSLVYFGAKTAPSHRPETSMFLCIFIIPLYMVIDKYITSVPFLVVLFTFIGGACMSSIACKGGDDFTFLNEKYNL